jgi:uncharacterized protein (DUF2236 family)
MIRQVVGEPVMALLVQRALVMEVAHTKVGAAVADHSRFRQQPIGRLWATSDAAMRLVFGDGRIPMDAAQQIYRFHDHINGSLPGGESYTAHDASLLLWVWATLVDTCDVAFTRWVHPYGPGEADAFYSDMCAFARFFGIPDDLVPPDRVAFASYLEGVLAGDSLGRTETSRGVVGDILWFRRWFAPAPLLRPLRVLAVGTLDPRLAQRLGLALDADDQRLFDRLDGGLARQYGRLPAARTRLPSLYLAVRRLTLPSSAA